MITRKIEPKDVAAFEYNGGEAELMKAFDWRQQLTNYLTIGPGWLLAEGENIFLMFGHFQLSPGVLQCWMLFNEEAKDHVVSSVREIRKHLKDALEIEGIHRIQTLIDEKKNDDADFVERLGFGFEATMEAFGPSREDVMIFTIIKRKI